MDKKYKLTEETIRVHGSTLYRIEALKDFGDVKKGDKGGFIEKENNLSQSDNCWIYDNAKVHDDAMVFGNAKVRINAEVFGNANIYEDANVFDNAIVFDNVYVYGDACVYDIAKVYDNANIYGKAKICGYARVYGNVSVRGDALIQDMSDYIVFKNWWSSGRYFTWTKSNNMWKVGCFYGSGRELIEKAYKDSELSGREYERIVKYVESIIKE